VRCGKRQLPPNSPITRRLKSGITKTRVCPSFVEKAWSRRPTRNEPSAMVTMKRVVDIVVNVNVGSTGATSVMGGGYTTMVNPEPNGLTGPRWLTDNERQMMKIVWVEAWKRAVDVEEVDDFTLRMSERKFERMSDDEIFKLIENFESKTENDGPE